MNILTEQQGKVLDFIAAFIKTNHFPPSRTEIADHLGFKSVNAADEHVKSLVRKGYISVRRGTARGITIITKPTEQSLGVVVPDGWVMVPKIPGQAHLNSIAMRYRHDFYLLNENEKDSALSTARQMYEECSGQGFFTVPAANKPENG